MLETRFLRSFSPALFRKAGSTREGSSLLLVPPQLKMGRDAVPPADLEPSLWNKLSYMFQEGWGRWQSPEPRL